jgi:hypothetical protein
MRILARGVLLAMVMAGGAGPALAQTASAASEMNGATTGLGESHRFASAAAATAHCPGDTVVWGSSKGLHYRMPGTPGYGTTKGGFYACKMEADDAGFSPVQ